MKGDDDSDVFSPEALAGMLDEFSADLTAKNGDNLELKDFDVKKSMESVEDYCRLRAEVAEMSGDPRHFDESGRTQLNLTSAALAGAKILIDEHRALRSLSRKLTDECGLDKEEFLYHGLSVSQRESVQAKDLNKDRQASLLESFVDFQRQLQFKRVVLNHVAERASDQRRGTRRQRQPRRHHASPTTDAERPRGGGARRGRTARLDRTPSNAARRHSAYNPLASHRIVESYAFEVASEVAVRCKRRKVAPIPINWDDEDDDEDNSLQDN